jgi:hypothetical protein
MGEVLRIVPLAVAYEGYKPPESYRQYQSSAGLHVAEGVLEDNIGVTLYPCRSQSAPTRISYKPIISDNVQDWTKWKAIPLTDTAKLHSSTPFGALGIIDASTLQNSKETMFGGSADEVTVKSILLFCDQGLRGHRDPPDAYRDDLNVDLFQIDRPRRTAHDRAIEEGGIVITGNGLVEAICFNGPGFESYEEVPWRRLVGSFTTEDGTLILDAPKDVNTVRESIEEIKKETQSRSINFNPAVDVVQEETMAADPAPSEKPLFGRARRRAERFKRM